MLLSVLCIALSDGTIACFRLASRFRNYCLAYNLQQYSVRLSICLCLPVLYLIDLKYRNKNY